MAWYSTVDALDGATLITELPLAGQGVTSDEADDRIARWAARLEYDPAEGNARQIALATELIVTGARADMERLQLRRAGHIETPAADATRREATEMLEAYNAAQVTEGEAGSATLGPLPWVLKADGSL